MGTFQSDVMNCICAATPMPSLGFQSTIETFQLDIDLELQLYFFLEHFSLPSDTECQQKNGPS